MSVWAGFRQMTWPERLLLPESCFWLITAKWVVAFVSFHRLQTYLNQRPLPGNPSSTDDHRAALIGRMVRASARHLPGEFACLTQALAARAMLARRGLPCVLSIGVLPGEQLNSHAWLSCGDKVITGREGHEKFTEMLRF